MKRYEIKDSDESTDYSTRGQLVRNPGTNPKFKNSTLSRRARLQIWRTF